MVGAAVDVGFFSLLEVLFALRGLFFGDSWSTGSRFFEAHFFFVSEVASGTVAFFFALFVTVTVVGNPTSKR